MTTKLRLWTVVLVALVGAELHAQDLVGTWQGTLSAGGAELRTVIRVFKDESSGLRGVLYSIDQSSQGIPVSPINLRASIVKMALPGIGAAFDGRLAPDGNTITGTFTQGGRRTALDLRRATADSAWAVPGASTPLKPMAVNSPEFEVATIKPAKPDTRGRGIRVVGRQLVTLNTSLADLIAFVHALHPKQIVGAPAWAQTERYDVTAQPDGEGQPSLDQFRTMLGKLMAERFKLAYHFDRKELSAYAITIGRNGPKLIKSAGNAAGLPSLGLRAPGSLRATNSTISDLAGLMQRAVLDRPVVDQTRLKERWDFMLTWKPDEFQFGGAGATVPALASNETLPDLLTAFEEQLGLKLKATKTQVAVFVIDRVARPSEN